MAAMAKPRTPAFVLNNEKSKEFFSKKANTAEKVLDRANAFKVKAGVVDPQKNDKRI